MMKKRCERSSKAVDLGGHDEVVIGEAADGVRREFEFHFVPPAVDVRVMVFGFRHFADLVDEEQRFLEILEREFARDRFCVVRERPVVDFCRKFERFRPLERRHAAFAGDALLFLEWGVHSDESVRHAIVSAYGILDFEDRTRGVFLGET